MRASFMKVRISANPSPRGPSSSAQVPSKLSSQVAEPRITFFFSGFATRKFSRPFSIRGATSSDRPSSPFEPGSVRASTTQTSPQPLVMNCFRPVMRQCPPSETAVVAMLPTSDPASGSVMATAPEIAPEASRGTQRSACSRVPKRMMGTAGPWWKMCSRNVLVQARERISPRKVPAATGKFEPPRSRGRLTPITPNRLRPSMFASSAGGWTTWPFSKATPWASISLARGAISRAAYSPATRRHSP